MDESIINKKDIPQRDPVAVLLDHLPLAGATVLDIGCGNGWITRALSASTECMIGLDPSMAQIGLATNADRTARELYIRAQGEALPFEDACFESVLLFNSLHHIPTSAQQRALVECSRVMKKNALLYIQEPMASGPCYELCRPLEDEAGLYAHALDSIRAVTTGGNFVQALEEWFTIDYRYKDFEAFSEQMICVKSDRGRRLDQSKTSLQAEFFALGRKEPDGWHFAQAQRVNLLQKNPGS